MGWIDDISGRHAGLRCYLIGKGPSLDRIDCVQSFLESGVVICLNEAIHKIESLGIQRPPTYVVQQDSALKDTCVPKFATHFMNNYQRGRDGKVKRAGGSDWNPNAVLYDPHDIGCGKSTQTAIVAIKIARLMGMKEFILIGFDCWKDGGSLEYAGCIGYSSKEKRPAERFLEEKHNIVRELDGCKYENIFL